MVQSSFILSAIALLGVSQFAVDAAPSADAANQLFGRIYKSHFIYARDVNDTVANSTMSNDTMTDSNNTTATENTLCPINLTNDTLDAVSTRFSIIQIRNTNVAFSLVQSFPRYLFR